LFVSLSYSPSLPLSTFIVVFPAFDGIAGNDTTMMTPSANQPSTISDDRYFIELKEHQLDKCAKMGRFFRLALAFKPRRPASRPKRWRLCSEP
jgi:hypothetical protein